MKQITLSIVCRECKKVIEIKVTQEELDDFNIGKKKIQNYFPNLNSSERELFLSQTCSTCWDKMFKGIEDD